MKSYNQTAIPGEGRKLCSVKDRQEATVMNVQISVPHLKSHKHSWFRVFLLITVLSILLLILLNQLQARKFKFPNNALATYFAEVSVVRPINVSKVSTIELTTEMTKALRNAAHSNLVKGEASEIPVGTRLLGAKVVGDRAYVNLSGAFTSGGGSRSMLYRLSEVKSAVAKVSPVLQLHLLINGKEVPYIGGEGLEPQ